MNDPKFTEHIFHAPRSNSLVLIPILNEKENIFDQLKKMKHLASIIDILVVDGGSTDGSLDELSTFEELGLLGVLVKEDKGKLSAQIRIGFSWAIRNNYFHVVTMDGNNKDDAEGIIKILEKLEAGFDFVQGSRFRQGGIAENTPLHRLLAIRFIHAPLTSLFARKRYTDTTNGFRGFSRRLLESEDLGLFRNVFDTYELLAYLPIRSARLGYKCCEVGVVRRYPNSGPIPTKIHGLRGNLEILRILLAAGSGKYNP
jgi:glycosyltransferase involved in cell wall biosynthesis